MDSSERVNVRCSAIIYRNDSVLLLRRHRDQVTDWVLPGGTPRAGESVASCARREVAEETGLRITVDRVAFLLEASNSEANLHVLDIVFTAKEVSHGARPEELEEGMTPVFYPLHEVATLALRPPIAGYLRGLYTHPSAGAPYLGNVWRRSELVTESVEDAV
jgi:8-oxo-dGTP diphosphatase